MQIDDGTIREVQENEQINPNEVLCPNSRKAQRIMMEWGIKKRQRYSELVKLEKISEPLAFYYVEFCEGRII